MQNNLKKIFSFLLFYGAWFGCLYSAKSTHPLFYSFISLLPLLILTFSTSQIRAVYLKKVFTLTVLGVAIDTILLNVGYYSFPLSPLAHVTPAWVCVIWLGFITSMIDMSNSLKGRYLLAAILGAIFGPFSYFTVTKFDVLVINGSISILAVIWFILTPAIVYTLGRSNIR